MVQGMNDSFHSFAIGLSLSVVLLFLILVAQFRSFKDPFLIMLAIPMGFIGVLIVLPLTHTTLNVMSLMGVLMLVGIAASNSILIVEFAHRLEEQGRSVEDAVITSCRVRLRPILMTSLATIIGMVPMALKLGTGSEQYAPLARAIIGGLTVSVLLTVFIVPAAYLLVYGRRQQRRRGTLMPRFSIRNPYFIIVVCLVLAVIGVTSLARMPVDLFPAINLPEVVVATFYSGMPPEDIETDITNPLERLFTLASGVDHMESRSLLGVSIIKVFFQPGTNADADVTQLSNLALADLKRLPPGTLPPVVLKFDASSLPVCLVTVKGEGLNETQLHDLAQFQIRNQIAVVKGRRDSRRVRRQVPPGDGLRRSLQAAVAAAERDGCGRRRQQQQPHSSGGRREGWRRRLLRLFQQPGESGGGSGHGSGENGGPALGLGRATSARPRTPASCSTTSSASTARNPPTSRS